MKVSIITIHKHHNYGAMLQLFALNQAVYKLGHKCKTIDCNIDPGTGRLIKWSGRPGKTITNFYLLCHRNANERFQQRFLDFSKQYIPLTNIAYETIEQLNTMPPHFDAYITGSDQVWNPSLLDRKIGHAYHLCFASPDHSKLISYAPSFGVDEIPVDQAGEISRYLQRYHNLSIREKRGQEIIFDLTGRKAAHVLDPTLLLSAKEYEPLVAQPPISGEYVLVYPMELGKNQSFLHLVKEVKKQSSLPIVCILPLNFDWRWILVADRIVLDAGPREFLGYFKNASLICTNSFHGTVFSIIFRKNFFGVPHSGTNSRIYSLLEKVGLLDRQLSESNSQKIREVLGNPIEYDKITPCLQDSINFSLEYLKGALGR